MLSIGSKSHSWKSAYRIRICFTWNKRLCLVKFCPDETFWMLESVLKGWVGEPRDVIRKCMLESDVSPFWSGLYSNLCCRWLRSLGKIEVLLVSLCKKCLRCGWLALSVSSNIHWKSLFIWHSLWRGLLISIYVSWEKNCGLPKVVGGATCLNGSIWSDKFSIEHRCERLFFWFGTYYLVLSTRRGLIIDS